MFSYPSGKIRSFKPKIVFKEIRVNPTVKVYVFINFKNILYIYKKHNISKNNLYIYFCMPSFYFCAEV